MSATAPTPPMIGIPRFPVRKFTVDEYHRSIRDVLLTDDVRYELLEGWVVPKMSRNPPHDICIELTQAAFMKRFPNGWRLRVQMAITTGDSEPEPDLAIVSGDVRAHVDRHPSPSEIALLVEVADTSLEADRTTKARIYARAGIAVYWIINLVDRVVEVHTEPSGSTGNPEYLKRQVITASESLPLIIAGQEIENIAVADLLP